MRTHLAALFIAVGTGTALGQYTFQMRLIPDGAAESPGGPSGAYTYPMGAAGAQTPTRVGFWLQARVSQTTGQNWGIGRASSPQGAVTSFVRVSDPAQATSISRGAVNAAGTAFGRGAGYRNGGTASGNTGNPAPGTGQWEGVPLGWSENGLLDNGGSGSRMTRISNFDSYVGPFRNDTDADGDGDFDDDGDGLPENPWGINGATHSAGESGAPLPFDTFSPWANLYRFYVDIDAGAGNRLVSVSASALLNAVFRAQATQAGGDAFAVQLAPGSTLSASYSINVVPTPGAAAALSLVSLASVRRRR